MVDVLSEWGQSNKGDLATAIKQAEVAWAAGCAYAKWQIFRPDRIAGPGAKRYWAESLGGSDSQRETFANNGMLEPAQWRELKAACDDLNLGFLATPFDLEAVDLLEDLGVSAYKIASGDITYRQLLMKVAATGKPVFLSTGAASQEEISMAVQWLYGVSDVTFLACSLAYPCADEDAQLGRISTLAARYQQVGYSDHTTRTDTALAAVVAGANVLEKHCTLSSDGSVPDDKMALEPGRLRQYVAYAQLGEKMRGNGMLSPTDAELAARAGARRSLHAATNILAGKTLQVDDFVCLRPAGPFAPADVDVLVGKTAARDIPEGKQIESYDIQF